jgi:hypothetical protein
MLPTLHFLLYFPYNLEVEAIEKVRGIESKITNQRIVINASE